MIIFLDNWKLSMINAAQTFDPRSLNIISTSMISPYFYNDE